MDQFLIEHALANVWCSPEQDYQLLFEPARLTGIHGVRRYVDVEWDRHFLPDEKMFYHVFQLGQIAPIYLNLIPKENIWYRAKDAINLLNVIVDIYGHEGRQYPRHQCFFKKTETRNMILAIETVDRIADPAKTPVYVRFYSNAFFGSAAAAIEGNHRTAHNGKEITQRRDSVRLKNEIENIKGNWPGHINVYHNGWLVPDIKPDLVSVGDSLEYIHDTSVKEVFDIDISDLETFESQLDGIRKYFIPRLDKTNPIIQFHDDADFYVYKKDGVDFKGVFYHKATPQAVRMVTQCDYSVPVQLIIDTANNVREWVNTQNLTLRVVIRRSGYNRPLVDEHHRIRDLYRLPDDRIKQATIGANANLTEWRAEVLENSPYPTIMRSLGKNVTAAYVRDAYGYNAISRLVGRCIDIPHYANGTKRTEPAFMLRRDATMYEYDIKGRLIDFYTHGLGSVYTVKNERTGYVENVCGRAGKETTTFYGNQDIPLEELEHFFAYVCPKDENGEITKNWEQAIEDTHYSVEDNVLSWLVDSSEYETAVRDNRKFYTEHFKLDFNGGLICVEVVTQDSIDGETQVHAPPLPFGKLDVFLNNKSLIENLDYFVDWPLIYICNKEYITDQLDSQRVTIRAYGQLDENGERFPATEYGYVKHGKLSQDSRFDLRDDLNMRFVIDGRIIERDQLAFDEDGGGVNVDFPDGTPYMVDEVIVPMDKLTGAETYSFRRKSRDLDNRVENYLTLYYPMPSEGDEIVIEDKYELFSPFLARVHDILLSGFFYPEEIKGQYSNEDIQVWMAEYEWLLEYDPIINLVDSDMVDFHAHQYPYNTTLDIYQFNFLQRVADIYFDIEIDVSRFVNIKEGWL